MFHGSFTMYEYMNIICVIFLCFTFHSNKCNAIGISPRDEFSNSHSKSSQKIAGDAEEVFSQIKKEIWDLDDTSLKNKAFVKKNADNSDDDDMVCKNKVCVYTDDQINEDVNKKRKSVAADVRVIVSTNIKDEEAFSKKDTTSKIDKSEDVPIVKGYTGVKSDDINWSEEEKDRSSKNHNEQPSSLITNPYSRKPTIVNINDQPQKPLNHYVPPNRPPTPWTREVQRKGFRTDNPVYIDNYPKYEHNNPNIHYESDTRDVRVPSGWSSNWKPIVPAPRIPGDYYHYNVNGNGNGFSGYGPHYETVCKCSRELVHGSTRTIARKSEHPWSHYETTTKVSTDGKLAKPFESSKNKE